MSRFVFVVGLLVLSLLSGCGEKKVDYEKRFDTEVEERWSRDSKWVDAIQHLSSGGSFVDLGEPEESPLDVPHVLPLLRRLAKEFSLEWQAITDEKDPTRVWVVVARLPDDLSIRKKIETVLEREQKTFPGAILQQWGHHWVSLDFLNQEQSDFLDEGLKKVMEE